MIDSRLVHVILSLEQLTEKDVGEKKVFVAQGEN